MNYDSAKNAEPEMTNHVSRLVFEVYMENGRIKTDVYETGKTFRAAREAPGTVDMVRKLGAHIRACTSGVPMAETGAKASGDQFLRLCKALGDQVLHPGARAVLAMSASEHILFHIDPSLADIPWEFICDEGGCFYRRYGAGRRIRSLIPLRSRHNDVLKAPVKIWFLSADSIPDSGPVPLFLEQLDKSRFSITISSAGDLTVNEAISKLNDYDLVHYNDMTPAVPEIPEQAGWRFSDGRLTPAAVRKIGERAKTPSLVISSGRSGAHIGGSLETAAAFLSSGSGHYIAVPALSPYPEIERFFEVFYRRFASAESIGRALHGAAVETGGKPEEPSMFVPYAMYGDPCARRLETPAAGPEKALKTQPQAQLDIPPRNEKQPDMFPNNESETLFQEMMTGIGTEKKSTFAYRSIGSVLGLLLAAFLLALCYYLFGPHRTPDQTMDRAIRGYSAQSAIKQNQLAPLLADVQRFKQRLNGSSESTTEYPAPEKRPAIAIDVSSARVTPLSESDFLASEIIGSELVKKSHINLLDPLSLANIMESMGNTNNRRLENAWTSKLEQLRLVIFLEIGGKGARRGVFAHLADIRTGSILETATAPLINDASIVKARERLAGPLLKTIKTLFPLKGTLIEIVDKDNAVVNIGGEHGLRFEQRLTSMNQKNRFDIISMQKNTCAVERIKGTDPLTEGLKVIPVPD